MTKITQLELGTENYHLQSEGLHIKVLRSATPEDDQAVRDFTQQFADQLAIDEDKVGTPIANVAIPYTTEHTNDLNLPNTDGSLINVMDIMPGTPGELDQEFSPEMLERIGRLAAISHNMPAPTPEQTATLSPRAWDLHRIIQDAHVIEGVDFALTTELTAQMLEHNPEETLPIGNIVTKMRKQMETLLPQLTQRQIIHGDLNPSNVLMDESAITVLDFNDASLAPPVFDLSVALAHWVPYQEDPVEAASIIIQAYKETLTEPLTEPEIEAAFVGANLRALALYILGLNDRHDEEFIDGSEARAKRWDRLITTGQQSIKVLQQIGEDTFKSLFKQE